MKKGFTLIELLVIIAIIGVLASIVLVSLDGRNQQEQVQTEETEVVVSETERTTSIDSVVVPEEPLTIPVLEKTEEQKDFDIIPRESSTIYPMPSISAEGRVEGQAEGQGDFDFIQRELSTVHPLLPIFEGYVQEQQRLQTNQPETFLPPYVERRDKYKDDCVGALRSSEAGEVIYSGSGGIRYLESCRDYILLEGDELFEYNNWFYSEYGYAWFIEPLIKDEETGIWLQVNGQKWYVEGPWYGSYLTPEGELDFYD